MKREQPGSRNKRTSTDGSDRGQLVLVAAAALAIALFPLVLAYLQLGYAGDIDAEPTGDDPDRELEQALERAVHEAAIEVDGRTAGGDGTGEADPTAAGTIEESEAAAAAFRAMIDADLERIETARLTDGAAARIEYAPGAAETWIDEGHWRQGVASDFQEPTAYGGVIVQERAGEPTIIAIAVDVHLQTSDATSDRRVIVRVPG